MWCHGKIDNLRELVPFFQHVESRDQTQVVRSGGKCLLPVAHPIGPGGLLIKMPSSVHFVKATGEQRWEGKHTVTSRHLCRNHFWQSGVHPDILCRGKPSPGLSLFTQFPFLPVAKVKPPNIDTSSLLPSVCTVLSEVSFYWDQIYLLLPPFWVIINSYFCFFSFIYVYENVYEE